MAYTHAILALVVAMVLAAALTPHAARLAWKLGAIDKPSDRGLAQGERTRLGGLAILIGVAVAFAVWMPGIIHLPPPPHAVRGYVGTVHTWTILAGCAVIAVVGTIDDIVDLHPLLKLVGQIIAAVIVVRGGAVVTDVTIPFIGPLQFPHEGGTLTVIWLVGLMNVVNFSDGIDGLAAGLCAIDGVESA